MHRDADDGHQGTAGNASRRCVSSFAALACRKRVAGLLLIDCAVGADLLDRPQAKLEVTRIMMMTIVVVMMQKNNEGCRVKFNTLLQTSSKRSSSSSLPSAAAAAAPSVRHTPLSAFQDHAHQCAACAVIAAAATLSSNSLRTGDIHASPSMEDIESTGAPPPLPPKPSLSITEF
jgi:hypothetical protein